MINQRMFPKQTSSSGHIKCLASSSLGHILTAREVDLQNPLPRGLPPLAHHQAVRQVAQVTQHAGILEGALLLGLVRRVLGVWTDKGENALKDGPR